MHIRFSLQIFLLKIPDGLFGAEVEHRLLSVLELNSRCDQCDAIHWYDSLHACLVVKTHTSTLLFTSIVTRFFDEIFIFISPDTFFHDLHDGANIF